jgi:hypothetical protein
MDISSKEGIFWIDTFLGEEFFSEDACCFKGDIRFDILSLELLKIFFVCFLLGGIGRILESEIRSDLIYIFSKKYLSSALKILYRMGRVLWFKGTRLTLFGLF